MTISQWPAFSTPHIKYIKTFKEIKAAHISALLRTGVVQENLHYACPLKEQKHNKNTNENSIIECARESTFEFEKVEFSEGLVGVGFV